jgi:hypothetical protein
MTPEQQSGMAWAIIHDPAHADAAVAVTGDHLSTLLAQQIIRDCDNNPGKSISELGLSELTVNTGPYPNCHWYSEPRDCTTP